MTTASPTKLRDGSWGARVAGSVRFGDTIEVRTRAGKSWVAVVQRVVWSGEGVTIVATQAAQATDGSRVHASSYRRGRRTGCSCGSREDASGELIDSPHNCAQCRFDAYDC